MKVGDIVVPDQEGFYLRSGSESYSYAVIVQVSPLVLVSKDGDMKWQSTVQDKKFKVIGTASQEQLDKCMTRLKG